MKKKVNLYIIALLFMLFSYQIVISAEKLIVPLKKPLLSEKVLKKKDN